MGLVSSKHELPSDNVFKSELENINKMLSNIINDQNMFINPYYNMFLDKTCDEVTLINSKKLNKYPKHELEELNKSIYIVSNKELAISKKSLCHDISLFYTRILRVLFIIKSIYDLENNGDYSIGGIITRNIITKNNIIEILSCKSVQQEMGLMENKVDFSKLTGFKLFVNNYLTAVEKKNLMQQLDEIFNDNNPKRLKKTVCNDILLTKETKTQLHKNVKCGGSNLIKVGPDNPILSWNLCVRRKKTTAVMNSSILKELKQFKSNYSKTFGELLDIINQICSYDNEEQCFVINTINNVELNNIEKQLKENVTVFFLQSIIDFKNILNITNQYSTNSDE